MLAEQGHELWVGDAAEIRARMVRKQKTDKRDAATYSDLLLENRFPRIWIPSPAERDLRQLLRHRFKFICMRSSVKNQLHALAMGQGVCRMKKLWAAAGRKELEALPLDPWANRRRQELLEILDQLEPANRGIGPSREPGSREAPRGRSFDDTARSGAGDSTGFCADDRASQRFHKSKQVVSYLGLNPSEESSGGRQRSGCHQQARQLHDAIFAGRSRPDGLTIRSGITAELSAIEVPPR